MRYLILAVIVSFGLSSCLNKFVETDDSLQKAEETAKISKYVDDNKLNLDSKTGVYYKLTRPNPTGLVAGKPYDYYISYTLKTLDGQLIVSKKSQDSVILNLYTSNLFTGFAFSLLLLKEGEKGEFLIPSTLAYGTNPPTGIAKNAVLLLEMEILDLISEDEKIDNYLKKRNLKITEKTASGLRFIRTNEPSTNAAPKDGDNVTIKYIGMFLSEKSFDSGTFGYIIGNSNLIPGFIEGIKKLKKGEKAKIIMPSTIGYGEAGSGSSIAPFTPLIFDIEITAVNGI